MTQKRALLCWYLEAYRLSPILITFGHVANHYIFGFGRWLHLWQWYFFILLNN